MDTDPKAPRWVIIAISVTLVLCFVAGVASAYRHHYGWATIDGVDVAINAVNLWFNLQPLSRRARILAFDRGLPRQH